MMNVTCVQNFRSFGRSLIDLLIESVFLRILEFLGLNPRLIRGFVDVLGVLRLVQVWIVVCDLFVSLVEVTEASG